MQTSGSSARVGNVPRWRRALGALVVLASGAVGGLATGAARSQTPGSTVADVVEVALVDVEVWETDRRGRPITGLGARDFEVRENGELV